jgi:hypothetical protein
LSLLLLLSLSKLLSATENRWSGNRLGDLLLLEVLIALDGQSAIFVVFLRGRILGSSMLLSCFDTLTMILFCLLFHEGIIFGFFLEVITVFSHVIEPHKDVDGGIVVLWIMDCHKGHLEVLADADIVHVVHFIDEKFLGLTLAGVLILVLLLGLLLWCFST